MSIDLAVKIQQLTAIDIELMRQLLNVFGDAFEDKASYCNHQPTAKYLQNLLSRDYFIIVI